MEATILDDTISENVETLTITVIETVGGINSSVENLAKYLLG